MGISNKWQTLPDVILQKWAFIMYCFTVPLRERVMIGISDLFTFENGH